MSAWQAIRFLSRQTTCRIDSTPACAIAIAQATFDACACAAVLSVAFIASTHCAISAIRSLKVSSVPPSIAGANNVIAQLQAIGLEVGSKNVGDYVDTSIIEGLKKDGYFDEMAKTYPIKQ